MSAHEPVASAASSLLALMLAATVNVVAASVTFLAQVSSGDSTGMWVAGVPMGAAVGALVYIAKLFANGQIVSRNVAESERKHLEREDRLAAIAGDSMTREQDYLAFLKGGRA